LRGENFKTPPGPKTWLPWGHLFSFASNPLGFLIEIAGQHGDVVHFRIRQRDVFLLKHPQDIEDVLVTHQKNFVKNPGFQTIKRILGEGLLSSQGNFHLRQRRMIQPAFHRQRLAVYAPVMSKHAERVSADWEPGKIVDVFQEMVRLTLAIVGEALFGTDQVKEQADDISQAINDAMSLFHHVTSPLGLLLERLPLRDRRFEAGRRQLDAAIYRIIQSRRSKEVNREDLLSILLQARDENGGSRMSAGQVRDEALTLLLAGHETTAVALTWTWFLLSQNPDAEAKLHGELEQVLSGGRPSLEDVSALNYTRAVLAEALRLYPPVYMIGRKALDDYRVRDYLVPADASIVMSQFITQRDGRFFADPDRFIPGRWIDGGNRDRPRFAYFPFGGGARLCIGEPFAWTEAILIIATLAPRWRLRLEPGYQVELDPRVTLRPNGGLPMVLERR